MLFFDYKCQTILLSNVSSASANDANPGDALPMSLVAVGQRCGGGADRRPRSIPAAVRAALAGNRHCLLHAAGRLRVSPPYFQESGDGRDR